MSSHNEPKTEGVPVPTVVISVIAVFVAGLLIGGFVLRFGKKGDKDCDCGPAGAAAAAEKRYKIFPRPHNPAKGPRTALVTIIEASDFQCPHCSNAVEVLNKIQATYPQDVRLVFMHNPLPNHPDAMPAAVASLAANQQGKFWPYHELLFKNRNALKKPDLIKYAQQVGLNVEQFQKDLDNRRLQIQVRQDQQQLQRLGVQGTPAFFVNGNFVRGFRTFAQLKQVVDRELRHARSLVKGGIAANQVYQEIMKTAADKIGGAPGEGAPSTGAPGQPGQRPMPPREDPSAVYKVAIEGRPFKGAKDAKVVLSEWSEFQCPWCARTNPLFADVLKKYPNDVKIVWFDFPLRFHKQAMPAAVASYEVFLQKGNAGFWAYHDKVFENQRNITDENLATWAKEVGADAAKVAEAIKTNKHEKVVNGSMMMGQKIGVRGTPTFLINGKKYNGQRDIATVAATIDAEVKRAGEIIGKQGVTLQTYYAHIQKGALEQVKYLPAAPGQPGQPGQPPQQPRQQLDPNAIYKVPVDPAKDPTKGPADALVTIVEWSDFQCPYCKWAACEAKFIADAYPRDVRLVFRHNPLPFHKEAMPAAEATMAAFAQKGSAGFWAMHDKLFPMEKCAPKPPMPHIREWLRDLPRPGTTFNLETFLGFAKTIGLNVELFKKDMESNKHQAAIKEQQAYANSLGARGTPAFFVNGKYVRGIRPFDQMKQMVDAEIAAAKKIMDEKKVPRAKVYETIIANGATAPVYLAGGAPAPGGPGGQPRMMIRPGGPGAPGGRGMPGRPGAPIRVAPAPAPR